MTASRSRSEKHARNRPRDSRAPAPTARRRFAAVAGAVALVAATMLSPVVADAPSRLDDVDGRAATVPGVPPDREPIGLTGSYREGSTLHIADGSVRRLPDRSYFRLAQVGGTLLGSHAASAAGRPMIDRIAADGTVASSVEGSALVGEPTGTAAAYVRDDQVLVLVTATGERELAAFSPQAYPRALTCPPGDPTGCLVWLEDGLGGAVAVRTTGDGTGDEHDAAGSLAGRITRVPGALSVADATSSGLVAAVTSAEGEQVCSEVRAALTGPTVLATCDYALLRFSPGQRFVSASHPYLDGLGMAFAAILDATTGEELARLRPRTGVVGELAWAGPDHLLVTVWRRGSWRLVRLGVDGTTETVARTPGGATDFPFTLPAA